MPSPRRKEDAAKVIDNLQRFMSLGEVAETLLDKLPVAVSRTELGPGARATVALQDKVGVKKSETYFLFAECRLPGTPSNPESGYTRDEIITNSGVMVFKGFGNNRFSGECVPLDRFLKARRAGSKTAVLLKQRIGELLDAIKMPDTFIEEANEMWANRPKGSETLVGPRYMN